MASFQVVSDAEVSLTIFEHVLSRSRCETPLCDARYASDRVKRLINFIYAALLSEPIDNDINAPKPLAFYEPELDEKAARVPICFLCVPVGDHEARSPTQSRDESQLDPPYLV